MSQLPLRKYIKVWTKRRRNNPKKDGSVTTSYTLEWVEYGKRQFMSLGVGATASYARQLKALKEKELNSLDRHQNLEPITWTDFQKKYLDTQYPGHDLPAKERKAASEKWGKSKISMNAERGAMKAFTRIVCPEWCHQIGTEQREKFVAIRITELPSPESVDTALRALRLIFNKAIEWKHVAEGANPFSGKGGATVGTRRKKKMQLSEQAKPKHFSRQEIVAILNQADQEVRDAPDDWARQRIRALIYFVAYTGVRAGEALNLEWDEVNLESGLADISFKVEHGLKTEGSENFIGLPDAVIPILSEWKGKRTCRWVFPNSAGNPWVSGAPGTKALDELKELAKRAGVAYATLKMFRHSLNTHGKQWFGLSREQMRMQLRHTTQETQKHYDHVDKANLHAAVRALDYRKSEN